MTVIEKFCPACGPGTKLVVRINRKTKKPFLGCQRWPDCQYTEEMPESTKMRLAGAQTLPGMDWR